MSGTVTLEDKLVTLCSALTEWLVVRGDFNVPRPLVSHAAIFYTMVVPQDSPEIMPGAYTDETMTAHAQDKVRANRTLVVNMDFCGPNAFEEATYVSLRCALERIKDIASSLNLAFSRVLEVTHIPVALVGGQKERRALVQFDVLTSLSINDELGMIQNVDMVSSVDTLSQVLVETQPTVSVE